MLPAWPDLDRQWCCFFLSWFECVFVCVCVCVCVHEQPVAQRRIYVGSLDYTVTDAIIRQLFHPFGAITNVDMPFDPAYVVRGVRLNGCGR